jgi:hypothetical protein
MGPISTSEENVAVKAIPHPHSLRDCGRFASSAAIYFMDGYSDVRFRIYDSKEELFLMFWDRNTSIAASSPFVFSSEDEAAFVPVPEPLDTIVKYPLNTPDHYKKHTSSHLMQVISMNMKAKDSEARLLIGLPYARKYPELFRRKDTFLRSSNACSCGSVQSLTEFDSESVRTVESNGYPARSFFAIFHILETPFGSFFNKKATQMELQPDINTGKLALSLPPIPFNYSLINGPIPLFDVNDPDGSPVGEVLAAHHGSDGVASARTDDAWPWIKPIV